MPADLGCPRAVAEAPRAGDSKSRGRTSGSGCKIQEVGWERVSPAFTRYQFRARGAVRADSLQNQRGGTVQTSLASLTPALAQSRVCRWGRRWGTPLLRERRGPSLGKGDARPLGSRGSRVGAGAGAAERSGPSRFSPPATIGSCHSFSGNSKLAVGMATRVRTAAIWVSRNFLLFLKNSVKTNLCSSVSSRVEVCMEFPLPTPLPNHWASFR